MSKNTSDRAKQLQLLEEFCATAEEMVNLIRLEAQLKAADLRHQLAVFLEEAMEQARRRRIAASKPTSDEVRG